MLRIVDGWTGVLGLVIFAVALVYVKGVVELISAEDVDISGGEWKQESERFDVSPYQMSIQASAVADSRSM